MGQYNEKCPRDYEKVGEVIPHIGPLPIVIPLKLFLDFLAEPLFPRGLTDSQSGICPHFFQFV